MKTRFRTPSLIFYGISGLVFVISIISFINALSWVDKPFPGFLIYKFPRVGSMGSTDWPGGKAGLRLMDKIVAVNERPIREGQDVVDIAREKSPGTLVHYTVESGEQIRKVSVPITKFSTIDFLTVFFLPFLGGLALLSIGFIVYILKPNVSTSWVFFFFCLVVSIYMVTGFEMQSTYLFVHLHYFVIPFQGAILFHLGSIFPEKKRFTLRHPMLEYGVYLPALILAIFFELQLFTFMRTSSSHPLSWIPNIKAITALTRIFILLGVIGFIILVLHSMFKTSSNVMRQRAKMIFFGVTLAFFPTVLVFLFVHFMKISFPFNFMIFFVLSFPASMAYSIVRHNLFDADTIIRRTVGYVVVTAIVVGAYVLVSVYLNVFLGKYQIAQSRAFPIIFTLIIILIFNPLRNRIQSLVDRIFFRKDYDYGEIIDKIGEAITSLLDLDQILKRMMKTFMEDMFIDTSSVMLLNTAKTEYQVYLADGERKREVESLIFRRDQPLLQIIEKERKELTKYDVVEDPKYKPVSEDCAKNFETLHASLIIPLIFQNEVTGLLNFGEKKSGKFYNREDIELLHAIAHQGAVAIENARLQLARIEALEQSRKELERLNRAKSKALDHLSHELRTPLALVQGNIRLIKRKAQMQSPPSIREEVFQSLEKNLDRLSAIQQETDQIIRSYQELETRQRLVESDYSQPSGFELIDLYPFTERILENVKTQAKHRNLHFYLDGQMDLHLLMDSKILEESLVGLLKNAIENTPDEGMVRIVMEQKAQWTLLKFLDFGIGITKENQRHLFDGFFHTLDTELYTSKKPYDFGAGGKGLDLLRMKAYSQQFGFDISVGSQRCTHLPTDRDLCPGKISECPHCKKPEDCLNSGGSTFCVTFSISEKIPTLKD